MCDGCSILELKRCLHLWTPGPVISGSRKCFSCWNLFFYLVTLTFDLLLKTLTLVIKFCPCFHGFHVAHVYCFWQGLSRGAIIFNLWPWPWILAFFKKKPLTLAAISDGCHPASVVVIWQVLFRRSQKIMVPHKKSCHKQFTYVKWKLYIYWLKSYGQS